MRRTATSAPTPGGAGLEDELVRVIPAFDLYVALCLASVGGGAAVDRDEIVVEALAVVRDRVDRPGGREGWTLRGLLYHSAKERIVERMSGSEAAPIEPHARLECQALVERSRIAASLAEHEGARLLGRMERVLDSLDRPLLRCLLGTYGEGLATEELAAAEGVSNRTIQRRRRSALRRLQESLAVQESWDAGDSSGAALDRRLSRHLGADVRPTASKRCRSSDPTVGAALLTVARAILRSVREAVRRLLREPSRA